MCIDYAESFKSANMKFVRISLSSAKNWDIVRRDQLNKLG